MENTVKDFEKFDLLNSGSLFRECYNLTNTCKFQLKLDYYNCKYEHVYRLMKNRIKDFKTFDLLDSRSLKCYNLANDM